jgi:hypothetical protein
MGSGEAQEPDRTDPASSLTRRVDGPTTRAFATLGETDAAALRAELVDLWSSNNQSADPNRTRVDAEYLEVVGVRG